MFRPLQSGALALGVLAAALAFSLALATVPDKSAAAAAREQRAGSRALSTLRFTDPFINAGEDSAYPSGGDAASDPDGFDLGDVAIGSSATRYLSALGGVSPYEFQSTDLGTGSTPGLFLDRNGILFGTPTTAGTNAGRFGVTLLDSVGGTRTGLYRFNAVTPAANEFRFTQDRLPEAQVGRDYSTQVCVLNSTALTDFSVVPGSVTFNGSPIESLQFAGLSLFRDGVLAGRPLLAGTIGFMARAEKSGQRALNRAGSAQDQAYSLAVSPEGSVQSVLAVTSAALKADLLVPERGSFALSALINSNGRGTGDFSGALFFLRVGRETFSAVLDSRGQSRSGDVRVMLNAFTGQLRVTVKNVDAGRMVDVTKLVSGIPVTEIVEIEIGETFRAAEALEFGVKRSSRNAQLSYRLGKQFTVGGLFQITNLRATEFFEGTAFRVNFILAHPRGRSGISFGEAFQAQVFIGPNFAQTLGLRNNRGSFPPFGVRKFSFSPSKRTGSFETYPLGEAQTGIPRPSQAGGTVQTFDLGLDVETTNVFFSGDASRKIRPFIVFP